jgi:hypothetical protein
MTKRNPTLVKPHRLNDRLEAEKEFFRNIQAKLSEKSQRVIENLKKVRAVYVESTRDKVLDVGFGRFFERYMAGRGEVQEEADIYFLIGKPGAGKTKAIGRLLREHPALQTYETPYGPITPYVSIKLKGYGIPRLVAAQIVAKAGYGQLSEGKQGELWAGLNEALRNQFVFLVHIDEAQHLLKAKPSVQDRKDLAEAIKGASVDPDWPIAFVFSGLPTAMMLPGFDTQVARRGDFTNFTDVMSYEENLVEDIVKQMAEAVDMDTTDLLKGDFAQRLAHAADSAYGRICQLTLSAIHEALHKDVAALEIAHFVKAYERRTMAYGRLDKNPFHAVNFTDLDPGTFLDLPEDEEEPLE